MQKINEKELKFLFNNIRSNDEASFNELFSKYRKLVYGVAFSILKSNEDSEDIVQTVFSKIYSLEKDKLPTSKEASWLYTVTKNEVFTFLKKKDVTVDLDRIYEISNYEDEINNVIDKEDYNELISKLPIKEKEIVSMKLLSDLSFREISKLVGEPIGTVKWRYYKAIHSLRILLGNLGMFIVTFIIGIRELLKNDKKAERLEKFNKTLENDIVTTNNNIKDENSEKENAEVDDFGFEDTINNSIHQDIEFSNDKEDLSDTITVEVSNGDTGTSVNYMGIGLLAISIVFLIFTIIFYNSFKKYQLKTKNKLSK